ncbi:hypothetical protein ES703_121030 [subsurface metagenome]
MIGNSSEITIDYVSLNCTTKELFTQEYYRIIDNIIGTTSDWIAFNSTEITILDDLGYLPANFTIEYKVIDFAGNVGVNSMYNNNYNYIIYSEEVSISLSDDTINLNVIYNF